MWFQDKTEELHKEALFNRSSLSCGCFCMELETRGNNWAFGLKIKNGCQFLFLQLLHTAGVGASGVKNPKLLVCLVFLSSQESLQFYSEKWLCKNGAFLFRSFAISHPSLYIQSSLLTFVIKIILLFTLVSSAESVQLKKACSFLCVKELLTKFQLIPPIQIHRRQWQCIVDTENTTCTGVSET